MYAGGREYGDLSTPMGGWGPDPYYRCYNLPQAVRLGAAKPSVTTVCVSRFHMCPCVSRFHMCPCVSRFHVCHISMWQCACLLESTREHLRALETPCAIGPSTPHTITLVFTPYYVHPINCTLVYTPYYLHPIQHSGILRERHMATVQHQQCGILYYKCRGADTQLGQYRPIKTHCCCLYQLQVWCCWCGSVVLLVW